MEDKDDIPVLVDTTVRKNDPKDTGLEVTKLEDSRVPLTIVTGMLQRSNSRAHLISRQVISELEKPHW